MDVIVLGISEALKIEMMKDRNKPVMEWRKDYLNPFWAGYFMIYKHKNIVDAIDWYYNNIKKQCIYVDCEGKWVKFTGQTLISSTQIFCIYFCNTEDASAFKIMWLQ